MAHQTVLKTVSPKKVAGSIPVASVFKCTNVSVPEPHSPATLIALFGPLAQVVEQCPFKAWVVSSILTRFIFMETEVKIEISPEQFASFSEQADFLKVSKEDIYYSKFNTKTERIENNEPLVRIRKSNSDYYFTTKIKNIVDGIERNLERETKIDDRFVIESFLFDIGYHIYFQKSKEGFKKTIKEDDYEINIEIFVVSCNNKQKVYFEIEVVSDKLLNSQAIELLKEKVSSFGLDFDKRDERSWISIFEN